MILVTFHQKLNGTSPTDPQVSCDRAIRYSGWGVRSVGPVGDFLETYFSAYIFFSCCSRCPQHPHIFTTFKRWCTKRIFKHPYTLGVLFFQYIFAQIGGLRLLLRAIRVQVTMKLFVSVKQHLCSWCLSWIPFVVVVVVVSFSNFPISPSLPKQATGTLLGPNLHVGGNRWATKHGAQGLEDEGSLVVDVGEPKENRIKGSKVFKGNQIG